MTQRCKNELRMRRYNMGMNDREIAEGEGVFPSTINSWRNRNGLPVNKKIGIPMEEVLTLDECKKMKQFLNALLRAHDMQQDNLNITKFIQTYRSVVGT